MWRLRQNTHNEDPIELNWNNFERFFDSGRSNGYNLPPANFIQPCKRPFWSMCPTLDENGRVELLIGSASGSEPRISMSIHYFAFAHSTVGVMFQYQIQLQRLVDSVEILERVSVLNCLLGLLKIQAICVNDSFCDKTIQINIFRLNCSESFKSIFHLISNCLWPNDWCNMKSDRGKVPQMQWVENIYSNQSAVWNFE